MINVYSIDKQELIAIGLKCYFNTTEDIRLAGYSDNVKAAFREIKKQNEKIDLILMDFMLDGVGKLDMLDAVLKEFPYKKTLVFSNEPASLFKNIVLKKGAFEFIPKDTKPIVIAQSIRNAAGNNCPHQPDFSRGVPTLSPQQAVICKMFLKGYSAKDIAQALGITIPAVNIHKRRAFRKFGVNSIFELMKIVSF